MKRTDVTYGHLDKVLLRLGFKCRIVKRRVESRVYEHEQRPEAMIVLPALPESDEVLDYHLVGVRTTLDLNGIIEPTEFAAKLQKAG